MFKSGKKESKKDKKKNKKEKKKSKKSSSSSGPPSEAPPQVPQNNFPSPNGGGGGNPPPKRDIPEEEGIVFMDEKDPATGRYPIKGGTLEKLVERLTYHKYSDQKYTKAFMLTFRSFTTSSDLLDMLEARFNLKAPAGEDQEQFNQSIRRVVRLRVSLVLKNWLELGFYDFIGDEPLQQKFLGFVNEHLAPVMEAQSNTLIKKFSSKLSGEDEQKQIQFSEKPPNPVLPKTFDIKVLTLTDFHPQEIARQLTLIEYHLFRKIQPWECINQHWMAKDKDVKAPNILAMITRFNDVSTWVQTTIVKTTDLQERIGVFQHILKIAEHCKSLNNFNAMMEIISGLNSSSVHRLKNTWGGLTKNQIRSFEEMQALMSRDFSYRDFRAYLHNVDPPCIPYLGVYLTDLTFVEEGNSSKLKDGKINFSKRVMLSEIIAEIRTYQNTPYCLEDVKFIQDWLFNQECLPEEQCYKRSLRCETRDGSEAKPVDQEDDEFLFGAMEKIPGYNFDKPDTNDVIRFEKGDANDAFVPIKGGTILKLVERLTYHKYRDMGYMSAFLATFNTFSNPQELIDLLKIRFNMPKPKNPSKQQLKKFKETRLKPIRLSIINLVKNWINSYGREDFNENNELVESLTTFLNECSEIDSMIAKQSETILNTLHQQLNEDVDNSINLVGTKFGQKLDTPIGKLIDYDPEQIAKELSLLDFDIFKKIGKREILCTSFDNKEEATRVAPNIIALKRSFNRIKLWVCSEIVKEKRHEERYKVLAQLVKIADNLADLKSFNAFAAIIAGLNTLEKNIRVTWEWVPAPIQERFTELQILCKRPKQLVELEKTEELRTQPVIPYIEMHCRQLNGIHDMLPDMIGDTQIINFEKRRKLYGVYQIWEKYQLDNYKFSSDENHKNFVDYIEVFSAATIKSHVKQLEQGSPPNQRPTVAELPVPIYIPKKKDDNYDFQASGSANNAEDSELAIQNQIKDIVHNIIKEDNSIFDDLVISVKQNLRKDLLKDLENFNTSISDSLTVLQSQFGFIEDEESSQVSSKRIVEGKFPNQDISEWSTYDSEGFVYGWAENVSLFIVNVTTLVHVTGSIEVADLGSVLRIAGLYVSDVELTDEESNNLRVIVITSSCSEEVQESALEQGVEIEFFE